MSLRLHLYPVLICQALMNNNEFEFEYGLRKLSEGKPATIVTVNISIKQVEDTAYMLITGNRVATMVKLSLEDYERVKSIIWVQNFLNS